MTAHPPLSDGETADLLLEHLWLQERLAQNTLDAYRRDLAKISARLAQRGLDFSHAAEADIADAVFRLLQGLSARRPLSCIQP